MQRWAFNLQIFFLNSRYQQILNILDGQKTVVQDRTIYEDAYIFAPNLHDMGLMTSRDFNNYSSLFHTMNSQIRPPDLLIYLRANISTLVDHIHRRGREYEGNMSLDYLKRLNQRYEDWIGTYEKGRLLIIETDDLNFADRPEDLGIIVNKINSELNGLF
jgi:deoxyadenosine/deoxycytidine kinase